MSYQLTHGQQVYAETVSAKTGLDINVVQAWLFSEENGTAAAAREAAGNHNWLNLGPGRTYRDPVSGALAAVAVINQRNMAGIRKSATQGPAQQLAAIISSPWDAGHYNGGATLRALYAGFSGQPAPKAKAGAAAFTGQGTTASTATTTKGGGITGKSFSADLLKIGLQAAFIGAGGWLTYEGARTAMSPAARA